MTELELKNVLLEQKEKENQILRTLVKSLLRDYIGDLCFISNKKLELSNDKKSFDSLLERLVKQRMNELDKYYSSLLSDNKIPKEIYSKLLKSLKNPIKIIK